MSHRAIGGYEQVCRSCGVKHAACNSRRIGTAFTIMDQKPLLYRKPPIPLPLVVAWCNEASGGSVTGGMGGAPPCTTRCSEIGAPCKQPNDCKSAFCVDGVCCESKCDGPCEACGFALTGADGACVGVKKNTDPDGDCAQEAPHRSRPPSQYKCRPRGRKKPGAQENTVR